MRIKCKSEDNSELECKSYLKLILLQNLNVNINKNLKI